MLEMGFWALIFGYYGGGEVTVTDGIARRVTILMTGQTRSTLEVTGQTRSTIEVNS